MGKHVLDIGGKRGIGVNVILELLRSNAELDGEAEDIDEFLAFMPNKMRAKYAVVGSIHDDFRPCDGLGVGPRGKPAEHVVDMNLD